MYTKFWRNTAAVFLRNISLRPRCVHMYRSHGLGSSLRPIFTLLGLSSLSLSCASYPVSLHNAATSALLHPAKMSTPSGPLVSALPFTAVLRSRRLGGLLSYFNFFAPCLGIQRRWLCVCCLLCRRRSLLSGISRLQRQESRVGGIELRAAAWSNSLVTNETAGRDCCFSSSSCTQTIIVWYIAHDTDRQLSYGTTVSAGRFRPNCREIPHTPLLLCTSRALLSMELFDYLLVGTFRGTLVDHWLPSSCTAL